MKGRDERVTGGVLTTQAEHNEGRDGWKERSESGVALSEAAEMRRDRKTGKNY